MSSSNPGRDGGHILVDLDGTLAHYVSGNYRAVHIGAPIPEMVDRVKRWLTEGREVRIFTARAWFDRESLLTKQGAVARGYEALEACMAIDKWCETNLGQRLRITFEKTPAADAIFDDRAWHVGHNTGSLEPIPPPTTLSGAPRG